MKRREFLVILGAAVATATPGMAQDLAGSIVSQLKRQGYRDITTSRTLLGRVRILATRRNDRREIVLNPITGEILRDLWLTDGGSGRSVDIVRDGNDDDDDADNDDNDDDDDEDDNSGPGGGGDGGGGDDVD